MKNFKVRFRLKNTSATMESIVSASNFANAKKMIEGQYGSSLQSIVSVNEV